MDFVGYLEETFQRRREGPQNLVVVRQVDSTNLLARRIVDEFLREDAPCPEVLVVAYEQIRGRGRLDHSWLSPAGVGVYATLVVAVSEPDQLQTLPLLVGVGLARTLARRVPRKVGLKWPNDLLVEGRKLGGILIEAVLKGGVTAAAVIGFGVNVHHRREDLDALPRSEGGSALEATSLALEGARLPSLAATTFELVSGVRRELTRMSDGPYIRRSYEAFSVHRPGDILQCRLGEKTVVGSFLGIDEKGLLRLESQGRELHIASGEVSPVAQGSCHE